MISLSYMTWSANQSNWKTKTKKSISCSITKISSLVSDLSMLRNFKKIYNSSSKLYSLKNIPKHNYFSKIRILIRIIKIWLSRMVPLMNKNFGKMNNYFKMTKILWIVLNKKHNSRMFNSFKMKYFKWSQSIIIMSLARKSKPKIKNQRTYMKYTTRMIYYWIWNKLINRSMKEPKYKNSSKKAKKTNKLNNN